MKNYILAAGIAVASLMLPSCGDDFLEVTPPSKLPADEYFATEAHMNELLNAAYTPLFWFDYSQGSYSPLNIMADVMADDFWVGGSDRNDMKTWHLLFNYEVTPNDMNSTVWIDCYNGVRRCNYVFENIESATDMSQEAKDQMLAETYALRAYYYSILWKFWGSVPYYTSNLSFPYVSAKAPADEVYEGIHADIQSALSLNVLPMKESDASRYGRVTKAMVYMVYAEVVLYAKDSNRYSTALDYMKDIIGSGQYDLHPDFDTLWDEENEWCSEAIWNIGYIDDNASRSWGNPYYVGGTVIPRLMGPPSDPFECGGKTFDGGGWGFCPVRQDAYDAFEAGDTRRDGTINNLNDAGVTYSPRYQDTGLWLRKYAAQAAYNDDQIADADLNYNNDYRVYRYAETLLNAAELVALGAGSGDAQGWLDKVRNRAGLGSVAPTQDNIINERRFEFMGEGKRYFDLVRSDKAASTLVPDSYGYRTNSWTPNKKYIIIPQSEINSSDGLLEQNTDY